MATEACRDWRGDHRHGGTRTARGAAAHGVASPPRRLCRLPRRARRAVERRRRARARRREPGIRGRDPPTAAGARRPDSRPVAVGAGRATTSTPHRRDRRDGDRDRRRHRDCLRRGRRFANGRSRHGRRAALAGSWGARRGGALPAGSRARACGCMSTVSTTATGTGSGSRVPTATGWVREHSSATHKQQDLTMTAALSVSGTKRVWVTDADDHVVLDGRVGAS